MDMAKTMLVWHTLPEQLSFMKVISGHAVQCSSVDWQKFEMHQDKYLQKVHLGSVSESIPHKFHFPFRSYIQKNLWWNQHPGAKFVLLVDWRKMFETIFKDEKHYESNYVTLVFSVSFFCLASWSEKFAAIHYIYIWPCHLALRLGRLGLVLIVHVRLWRWV